MRARPVGADTQQQFLKRLQRDRIAAPSDTGDESPLVRGAQRTARIRRRDHLLAHGNAEFRMVERSALEAHAVVAERFEESHQRGPIVRTQIEPPDGGPDISLPRTPPRPPPQITPQPHPPLAPLADTRPREP